MILPMGLEIVSLGRTRLSNWRHSFQSITNNIRPDVKSGVLFFGTPNEGLRCVRSDWGWIGAGAWWCEIVLGGDD